MDARQPHHSLRSSQAPPRSTVRPSLRLTSQQPSSLDVTTASQVDVTTARRRRRPRATLHFFAQRHTAASSPDVTTAAVCALWREFSLSLTSLTAYSPAVAAADVTRAPPFDFTLDRLHDGYHSAAAAAAIADAVVAAVCAPFGSQHFH
ncbi:uncharacterized protein LOC143018492 [Oratosquilla oratoria]|uniref:uncharacterized protein LOC143018492 n=1 Tax=Oratosquilla oratoria TaxID=337810 RepID=UPI003F7594C7